jgi:uncharacterized membrane protein YhaH (DUF805 family)
MAMWYYATGEERQGPVEATEIERLVATGTVTADTLVWREGLAGWEAASAHFPSTTSAGSPPPLAPAAPSAPATPRGPMQGDQIGPDGLYTEAPSRSFGEAISTCFSKYVTFSGRASRSEYWFYFLFIVLISIVASIVDVALFPTLADVSPINSLVSLATFLPSLAVAVRRLHDTDRSGWWIGGFYLGLLAFAGILGAIIASSIDSFTGEPSGGMIALFGLGGLALVGYAIMLLVFFCQKGTLGPNRFG